MVDQAVTTNGGVFTFVDPILEQFDKPEGRWPLGLVLVVALLVLIVALAFTTSLFGSDDTSTTPAEAPAAVEPPADDATADEAPPVDDSTTDDASEPTPLTEGTWRFISTQAEGGERAMYDFAFGYYGTFWGDGAAENHGTYTVNGSEIVLDLTRVGIATAGSGGNDRSEEVTWSESFVMTRSGDMMTGTWYHDSWYFDYREGFVALGQAEPETGVYARPQTANCSRPSRPSKPSSGGPLFGRRLQAAIRAQWGRPQRIISGSWSSG